MTYDLNVMVDVADDLVDDLADIPAEKQFQTWVDATLTHIGYTSIADSPVEISIRIVSETEMVSLNGHYRNKSYPTNVLSFPAELPEDVPLNILGDMVVCAAVIQQEALAQHKTIAAHWLHMTVHSVLHLLGYDHIQDEEAEQMEALEVSVLQQFGIANPYQASNIT